MGSGDHSAAMLQRRRVITALGASGISLLCPAVFAAKDTPPAPVLSQIDMINLAMRQRTLIQRLAKLHVQILVGARASDAKRLIGESATKFDALHTTHRDAANRSESTNYQVAATLEKINKAWPQFRGVVEKPPSEKSIASVASQCDDLSRLINQSTLASAQYLASNPVGQLVDRSGRQCFLSQRIAKNYFLRTLQYKVEDANRDIAEARRDFTENASILAKAQENTTEIKFLLQLGATQWPYFDDAVSSQSRKESSELDYNVATTAENMLEVLERTNLLYSKLPV